MRMFIIQCLATSFFAGPAFAATTDSVLGYKARTEIGERVVIEAPYVTIGKGQILIDGEDYKGVCLAYDLGEATGVEWSQKQYQRLAIFDSDGAFRNIWSGYGVAIVSITCKKK